MDINKKLSSLSSFSVLRDLHNRLSPEANLQESPIPQAVWSEIHSLKNKNSLIRIGAAWALKRLGDSRAVPALIERLSDSDHLVRAAASEALGSFRDPRAVQPLIRRLTDPEPFVRQMAAEALGMIGDAGAVEPLKKRLRDDNTQVRQTAADGLGEIGDSQAVDSLIQELNDEEPSVRAAAAKALGRIGDPRVADILIKLLNDYDPLVRQAAMEALGQLGNAPAVDPIIHQTWCVMDSDVLHAAAKSLEKIAVAQRDLASFFPRLYCTHCARKPVKKRVRISPLQWQSYIVCPVCRYSSFLAQGIEEAVGVIGGECGEIETHGEKVFIRLWNEETKTVRIADIDSLEIRGGREINYTWALNAVLTELNNDSSHPSDYTQTKPVYLRDNPPLQEGDLRILNGEFGGVRV